MASRRPTETRGGTGNRITDNRIARNSDGSAGGLVIDSNENGTSDANLLSGNKLLGNVGDGILVTAVSRAWREFLDDYDLFVCPTGLAGPCEVGYPPQDDRRYSTAEAWIDAVFELLPFTPIANTTGQPSISLPLGATSSGLPIGAMLTAQTLREDLLFSVAAQMEQAMPWADRAPEVVAS